MNTIRCPHCGVVNLRKFITYPYCAGCGKHLPATPRPPSWRRPVGPQVWAFLLCGSALGLLAGVALLVTPDTEAGQLVVYGNSPTYMTVGQTAPVQIVVDQTGVEGAPSETVLKDLTMRIPSKLFTNLDITSIQPRPDGQSVTGNGHYYSYNTFPRSERIVLTLRLRKATDMRFFLLFSARSQISAGFSTNVRAMPQKGKIPLISTPRYRR